ncbi:hypothetical protein TNCV_2069071 [Trichonephila clavipes]|uniref:Uncharacterized protein n=1 Tax=Trichonephila clavipes TaxID=2585209 RepID=A0A8X7BE99_TRICX|nr:hypothetical protein TNCV_2069071 [Trichonephila clavipes]
MHGDTLNSHRAASPLVRLAGGEERWEASDHPQDVLPQNWSEAQQDHIAIYMVLKTKTNDRRKYQPLAEISGTYKGGGSLGV